MILNGNIYVTTDINVAIQCATQYKVICIGEATDNEVLATNAMRGSILIPPYNALQLKFDTNDNAGFIRIYSEYLGMKEQTTFTAAIIAALLQGTNIMLYLNQDEYDIYFIELWNYLRTTYGITVGLGTYQPAFNDAFSWVVCSVLYKCGLVTGEQFIELYPAEVQIPDEIIPKLAGEFSPNIYNIKDISFNGYKQFFANLVILTKKNNNVCLASPISKVGM